MNYILYISILFSLVLPLSDEQIDKIKSKTDDVNYAPNFTLNSIEERDFSNIKNLLIAISNANILFRIEKGEYAKTVEELIYNSYLSMDSSISNRWIFEINSNYRDVSAEYKSDQIKIVYNNKEESFSFVISNENLMSVNKTVTLSDLVGKVVLINFWATWCGPCRLEIPDFNELYKTYNDRGLEILSISISDSYEQLIKFKNAYNMFYPILYGDQRTMAKIQRDYGGVYSIPMSFLIDKNGEIIRVYPGAILKQFDPNIYMDLVLHIEDSLLK